MTPLTTVGLFPVALAAVFTGGAAAGQAVGPLGAPVTDHRGGPGTDNGGSSAHEQAGAHPMSGGPGPSDALPGGLMASASGYDAGLAADA